MTTLTSIGFGCGRLKTGRDHRTYVDLVEAAVQGGVRYFDCAPLYGLGFAENLLGEVLANHRHDELGARILVATKVGIARPSVGGLALQLRSLLRPVVKAIPMGRKLAQAGMARATRTTNGGQFSRDEILLSVEDSRKRLGLDHLNALLLHEPAPENVGEELLKVFAELMASGVIGAQGSSTNEGESALVAFGEISQFRWHPRQSKAPQPGHVTNVHGVVADWREPFQRWLAAQPRVAAQLALDYDLDLATSENASALLIYAVATAYHCRVIFSTNTQRRLTATLVALQALETRAQAVTPALAAAMDAEFAAPATVA